MAYEAFVTTRFNAGTIGMIERIRGITDEYAEQGFKLTVRQLYYQLVARGEIPNNIKSYHRIVNITNDARMAGMIDWSAIEDRTREFIRRTRWQSGGQILDAAARSYHMDMWINQETRPYVVIEKEALVGVLDATCQSFDVPLLAARGYPSASVLYEFVKRDILPFKDQDILIIHLGDHDPSGIDMTRDLSQRIETFCNEQHFNITVDRIALNMDQVTAQKPPPNPAKVTDSRFESYERRFGKESWELDALQPAYLNTLVRGKIEEVIVPEEWAERAALIKRISHKITKLAETF